MKKYLLILSTIIFSITAHSTPSHKSLYEKEALSNNIPKEVLYSIALTESGVTTDQGNYMPWPYTLNWLGNAYRFNSKDETCQALSSILEVSKSVDIGETQLHWRYNSKEVNHPCDYIDREKAIKRTAKILKECYAKHGNWVLAAGCYHRPAGGNLSRIYEKKFLTKLKQTLKKEW